jgi:predicted nucleic acid binding AN1-type Zn finger protein
MRVKPTRTEARLLKHLHLPSDALLAVALGLSPSHMCAAATITSKCNSCGGKLCGQRGYAKLVVK